jgi:DNA-binding response OmpR family regulator
MGTSSILIVDDERNMRATLADILSDEGYEVVAAESGERALELLEDRAFDLVLLDIRMAGMDGMEVFHQIRRKKSDAQVVLMSAFSSDLVRRQALDEGAIAFVRKPLDVESLLKLIRGTKKLTILAVESETCVSGLIGDRLRREGYRVLVVHTPSEALELVQQIHSHVVFLDENLVDAAGPDFYSAVKQTAPATRLVLVGRPLPETPARADVRHLPVDAVLLRPLRFDEVLRLLQALRRARAPEHV